MILLALRTGIAPSVWAEEGERAIVTAFDLLDSADQNSNSGGEVPEGWVLQSG